MAISGSDGSIILTTRVDQSGLNNGIRTMKGSINTLSSSFTKLGAALGVSLGIGALVQFGKQAIQLASDLQEVQNVVDVAFGSMSYKIEEFSKSAIEKFGISELTAKRTASTYMAMAKGMGIADDVASDMAITMTGLTADLASFYNISQERADVILKSVYTGETETLKQLGIVMTEVNLANFAMSKGITKSLSAMTQQEKTMLRYQFVLEQTRLASGDFARTQDSFANRTRVLSEKWKEMQAIFGETLIILADGLLPVLEVAVERLTIVALYIAAFARGMSGATEQTQKAATSSGNLATESTNAANSLGGATDAVKDFGKETKEANKQLAQFDDLMILQSSIAEDLSNESVLDDISGIGNVSIPNIPVDGSAIESFLDSDTLKKIDEFEKWVSENSEKIKTAFEIAGYTALGLAILGLIGKIGNLLGWFKKKDTALDTQTRKTQTETSAVREMSNAFAGVPALAYAMIPALAGVGAQLGQLAPTFQTATAGASALIPALSGVSNAIPALAPAFSTSAIGANSLSSALSQINSQMVSLSPTIGAVSPAISGLKSNLDGVQISANAFIAEMQSLPNSLTGVSPALINVATSGDLVATSLNGAKTAIDTLSPAFQNALSGINGFEVSSNVAMRNIEVTFDTSFNSIANSSSALGGAVANGMYNGLQSAADNTVEFANSTSSAMASWGENFAQNTASALKTFTENFALAMASAAANWAAFKKTTGEKASSFWSENKAGIIALGALVGLTITGIALAPYTGGASLALPALAKGGIVPRATTAVVGEKGKEAVLPLENNTEWMDMLADRIMARQGMNGGGNTTVVMEIDGRELARVLVPNIETEQRITGVGLISK